MKKPLMDTLEVQKYLPHRYPFLMIDQVIEINRDARAIVALKNVTINEPFFPGHVPALPVMPGVLMIEAMAQASGILSFYLLDLRGHHNTFLYLAGVDEVRFKMRVMPGDQLLIHSEVYKQKKDLWKFKTHIRVGDELACSAELLLAKGPGDNATE